MAEPLRIVSYGGGVQSTALLVLAARRYIDFPTFVFANVGADSEHPETMRYVREVAWDYAESHGIAMHEVEKRKADGEVERSTTRKPNAYETPEFPLLNIEWKGRRGLSRADCEQVIRDAGLPVPPKSSCYFCPFHRIDTWRELARNEPALFADAVAIEAHANDVETAHGRTRPLFLTRFGKPLDEVIDDSQQAFDLDDGPEGCDDGYCWT